MKHRKTIIFQENTKYLIPIIMIILGITLMFSSDAEAKKSNEILADTVNIGDLSSETGHNLFGWGPIVTPSGSSWGGGDDGNLRVVWYNDTRNPSDIPTNSPDENWSTLEMVTSSNYKASRVEIRALDGIADDSFEIYINENLVYTYADQGSTETWKTHDIDISNLYISGKITIKIISTGEAWQHFDTYGQLGISWIKLYATQEGTLTTVRLTDSQGNPLSDGFVQK